MNYSFGILSGLLLFSFVISFVVAFHSWKHRRLRSGRFHVLLALAVAEWALAGVFEAAATQIPLKMLWSQISYLGIVFTPLLFLLFAISYGRFQNILTPRNLSLLTIIPVITLLMALTSNYHTLLWEEVSISETGNIGIYNHGIWFWMHISYSYALIITGAFIILWIVRRLPSSMKGQVWIVATGATLPLLANLVYVTGVNPIPGVDWTPIMFSLSGLFLSIGIFRFGMFNAIPIARNILVETMQDGVLVLDTNDQILDINPRMVEILGHSSKSVVGKPIEKGIQDWPAVLDCLHEHIEYHTNIDRVEGQRVKHFDFKVTKIFREDGRHIGRLVVCRDDTEKIEAQLDLIESQSRLTTLSSAATEAIFISEKGICLEQNDTAERMFGYSLAEAVGKKGTDWIIPEHREQVMKNMLSGREDAYEAIALRKDGSTFIAEISAKMMQYKEKVVRITILRDISKQKEAEQQLTRSERSLRDAQQVAKMGNWVLTIDGNKLTWSEEINDILELDPADQVISFETLLSTIHPDDKEFVNRIVRESLNDRKPFDIINRVVIDNDRIKYVHQKGEIITDETGASVRAIGTVQDITKQKVAELERLSLETKLRQAHKLEAIGTMVGGVAHELNNILQSIFLYCGLVQEDLPDDEELQSNMQHIVDDGERARDIVAQILTFSRKNKIDMKPRYIDGIIRDALVFERASLPPIIDLQQTINSKVGMVLCDKTQIHQMIINLCNNARQAMGETGGVLSVSLQKVSSVLIEGAPEQDVLELLVNDTGQGMDAKVLENIFVPFFTTKDVGKGTGLGLSVIHGIVEIMGGQISVSSKVGEGTSFRILLPMVKLDEPGKREDKQSAANEMTQTLLLVDDEANIRRATKAVLTRRGFMVDTADSGDSALELFLDNTDKYDVIVTDLSMPTMSGLDLTKIIRTHNAKVPIILSSGHLGIDEKKEYKNSGVTGFMQKPWTALQLIERLQDLVL